MLFAVGLLFVKGFLVGLSIAIPVGPMGTLCIRRCLAQGRIIGFLSGLGIATADAFYGALAAYGLTAIAAFLFTWQRVLELAGGAFLIYLGIYFLFHPPKPVDNAKVGTTRAFRAYASVLVLTLGNPTTIASFIAIFAGLGLASANSHWESLLLVTGVFLGSAAWWFFLSQMLHVFRRRISFSWLQWANMLAGAGIALFGLAAVVRGVL